MPSEQLKAFNAFARQSLKPTFNTNFDPVAYRGALTTEPVLERDSTFRALRHSRIELRPTTGHDRMVVYVAGGGFCFDANDTHRGFVDEIAGALGADGCLIRYRLAPEHPFPAAVIDSAAATRWIIEQAGMLGIDANRVAVGGDSAGGNLAAVVAIMARDRYLPPVDFQVLIYPATDMGMGTASVARVTQGFPLTATTMRWFIDHYLSGPHDVTDWRASPLRAASLAGTAPAFVSTCTHDPLAVEGAAYAARLAQDGVSVSHMHVADQMHGYVTMGRLVRASAVLIDTIAATLRARWAA